MFYTKHCTSIGRNNIMFTKKTKEYERKNHPIIVYNNLYCCL